MNNSYLAGTSTTDATIRATAGLLSIIGETFIAADESSPFLACEGATVYLLDGKFTGDISVAEGAMAPVITGGRFRKNSQEYCATGYMMKTEGDWYGVVISSDVLTPVEGSCEFARFLANADGTLEMPIPKPDIEGDVEQSAPAGFYRLCVSVSPKVD